MTTAHEMIERTLEGHFACSKGLVTAVECLGHSYSSRTANYDLAVSLPTLRGDWQSGLLDPPTWTHSRSRSPNGDGTFSDGEFDWGVTVGFHNEPDGTQVPESARIRRWRFQTTIHTTNYAADFFSARARAVKEIEDWWDALSLWVAVFTKQDMVEIGRTRSGIRVGPIVTWSGDKDGYRANGTVDQSHPVVSDQVDTLDHRTLLACMALTANRTEPPLEWLLIRDARSLVAARQYRRAAIDACTAAEVSLTSLIDSKFDTDGTPAVDRKDKFDSHHGIAKLKKLHKEVGASGTLPKFLVEHVGALRNKAAHKGYNPTPAETTLAIDTAMAVVELATPLSSLR